MSTLLHLRCPPNTGCVVPGCSETSEDDTAFCRGLPWRQGQGSLAARQLWVVLIFLGSCIVPLATRSRPHNDTVSWFLRSLVRACVRTSYCARGGFMSRPVLGVAGSQDPDGSASVPCVEVVVLIGFCQIITTRVAQWTRDRWGWGGGGVHVHPHVVVGNINHLPLPPSPL